MEFEADDDDEWVWPNELKEARLMEGILRCQVCGEFLSGPVLLRECRHSFCSECVRKHLLARGTNGCCPECKCACSSSDLIPNRPLEQLVGFFRALKPKVLHLASTSQGSGDGATLASLSTSDLTDTATASTSTDITARMPTTSYNFLKDSQIRQLLKSAGLLAILPTSKDNMITCHKEYTMLWNAQLDTMNPKNASQVRAEVVTKFRQRQHETAAKASTRRSLGLRPDDPIEKAITRTSALNDNFRKLAQQVKAQKANAATTQPNPPAASPSTASPAKTPSKAPEVSPQQDVGGDVVRSYTVDGTDRNLMPNGDLRFLPRELPPATPAATTTAAAGPWRHLYSNTLSKPIFVHSSTAQVTDIPPPAFASMTKPPPPPIKRPMELPTKWSCARCTLENESHVDTCEACGAPTTRPARPKRSRQSKLSL